MQCFSLSNWPLDVSSLSGKRKHSRVLGRTRSKGRTTLIFGQMGHGTSLNSIFLISLYNSQIESSVAESRNSPYSSTKSIRPLALTIFVLGHGASPGFVHVQPSSSSKKAFRKFFSSSFAQRLLEKLLLSLNPGTQHCRSEAILVAISHLLSMSTYFIFFPWGIIVLQVPKKVDGKCPLLCLFCQSSF